MRRAWQEETPEDREMRRAMDKAAKQVRVEVTEDDCATRCASMRIKMQKIRANETEKARAKRRDSNRERMQENRALQTPEAMATQRICMRI